MSKTDPLTLDNETLLYYTCFSIYLIIKGSGIIPDEYMIAFTICGKIFYLGWPLSSDYISNFFSTKNFEDMKQWFMTDFN